MLIDWHVVDPSSSSNPETPAQLMPVAWCCLPSVNILYSIWIIIWKCYLWFIHSQPFMDLPIASLCNSRCVHKAPECVWVCSENFMLYSQWMCTIVLLLQFFSFFEYILYNFPFYSIPFYKLKWEIWILFKFEQIWKLWKQIYSLVLLLCLYIFPQTHKEQARVECVCDPGSFHNWNSFIPDILRNFLWKFNNSHNSCCS